VEREVKNALVIVMTADRGLCGAFNTNVNKAALQLIRTKYAALGEKNVHVLCIGKKSAQFFKKYSYNVITTHVELLATLNFDSVAALAEQLMTAFSNKEYDAVDMVYSRFKNAATQIFTTEQFLPIAKVEEDAVAGRPTVNKEIVGQATNNSATNNSTKADFIFEPTQAEIIETLMPKILKVQLWKGLLDTNASEHGARMTAMDKATENANELLKSLRISYNRARQAAITTELSEIVAGAAALQGA
jgi:F-type H+-transporting ATPase subunit gamma